MPTETISFVLILFLTAVLLGLSMDLFSRRMRKDDWHSRMPQVQHPALHPVPAPIYMARAAPFLPSSFIPGIEEKMFMDDVTNPAWTIYPSSSFDTRRSGLQATLPVRFVPGSLQAGDAFRFGALNPRSGPSENSINLMWNPPVDGFMFPRPPRDQHPRILLQQSPGHEQAILWYRDGHSDEPYDFDCYRGFGGTARVTTPSVPRGRKSHSKWTAKFTEHLRPYHEQYSEHGSEEELEEEHSPEPLHRHRDATDRAGTAYETQNDNEGAPQQYRPDKEDMEELRCELRENGIIGNESSISQAGMEALHSEVIKQVDFFAEMITENIKQWISSNLPPADALQRDENLGAEGPSETGHSEEPRMKGAEYELEDRGHEHCERGKERCDSQRHGRSGGARSSGDEVSGEKLESKPYGYTRYSECSDE